MRLVWRLDTPVGLIVMFSIAFLLRLAIAPHLGFVIDLRFFHTWAVELARSEWEFLRDGPGRGLSAGVHVHPPADRQALSVAQLLA
jgi:hypothetical protein